MKPTVYLETTIISYVAGRSSRDLVVAAHQQITREWWDHRRPWYLLHVSQLVWDEAMRGDQDAAARRTTLLKGMPMLDISAEAGELAGALMLAGAMPENARADALHVAVSAVAQMDYLVTWNCAHINNAERLDVIESTCQRLGYDCPRLCSPEELMGVEP